MAAEAERLNAASWEADNRPVSLRTLQRELHIGQPRATALLEALASVPGTAPEDTVQDPPGTRIPLVLGDPIRRVTTVNGATAQH